MWSRSVYTGTLSSCLPHSMLGSKTSPSPKIKKKKHAQICQVWGPTSDWVDFCPVDCYSGGTPVEGQHNENVSQNSRIKKETVHFLWLECSDRPFSFALLLHWWSWGSQIPVIAPWTSHRFIAGLQYRDKHELTDNSASSIPLSLKVFWQWREGTAPQKLDKKKALGHKCTC